MKEENFVGLNDKVDYKDVYMLYFSTKLVLTKTLLPPQNPDTISMSDHGSFKYIIYRGLAIYYRYFKYIFYYRCEEYNEIYLSMSNMTINTSNHDGGLYFNTRTHDIEY